MTAQNLPAMVEEYGTGLEDIEDEVGGIPRIAINHKAGVFKDTLTGEEFAKIVGVPLGVIRQRVMWSADMDEAAKPPLCKSNNGKVGYPNSESEKNGGFPWSDAKDLNQATLPKDEQGRTIISCEGCPFAEWGRDKTGKPVPPPCKERYTIPIMYNREGNSYDPPYMDSGILGFQGSGIKPTKTYAAGFIRTNRPLYSAVVEITLQSAKRGSVDYAFPVFRKVGPVPDADWEMFGRELPPLREYLTRPPRSEEEGGTGRGHGQSSSQAAANAGFTQQAAATATVAVATPVVDAEIVPDDPWQAPASAPEGDDDLPF
jgi:hypothetical protein